MPDAKKIIGNIALSMGTVLICLVIGEIILRQYIPWTEQRYSVAPTSNQYEFYRYDEKLGWANAAQMNGHFQRHEFHYPVHINRFGMRDRDINQVPASNVFRIAFLGDSYVWGIGISDEQRFTNIVGSLPGIEALNFGVSGYAPVQYLLDIDRIISFKPNLVIIAICYNDFEDNIYAQRYGYFKPYASLDKNGAVTISGYPIPNIKKFGANEILGFDGVLRHSVLAMTAYALLRVSIEPPQDSNNVHITSLLEHDRALQGSSFVDAVAVNKALLAGIRDALSPHQIRLVLLTAVTKLQYHPQGKYGHVRVDHGFGDTLTTTGSELSVDVIDTTDELNGFDFWEHDGHWNPRGHQKTAAAVCRYLQRSTPSLGISCAPRENDSPSPAPITQESTK